MTRADYDDRLPLYVMLALITIVLAAVAADFLLDHAATGQTQPLHHTVVIRDLETGAPQ